MFWPVSKFGFLDCDALGVFVIYILQHSTSLLYWGLVQYLRIRLRNMLSGKVRISMSVLYKLEAPIFFFFTNNPVCSFSSKIGFKSGWPSLESSYQSGALVVLHRITLKKL